MKNTMLLNLTLILLVVFWSCSNSDDNSKDSPETVNTELLEAVGQELQGYKIAFGDTQNIYIMNPDGSNIEQLAEAGPISGYVSWGPNVKYVYYASAKGPTGSAWEAWRVNVQTKVETKISNFGLDVRSLGVSPDNQTMAISVMTGNSNINNNNDNLTQFSTNLYTVAMAVVNAKIQAGEYITMSDLTPIQSAANSEQFWFEELSWNNDANSPTLAYTKTWRYDEDDVSYTHAYTIKPNGSANTLISQNKDLPVWSMDNTKLSFLDVSYYDFNDASLKQINISGINNEVSGAALSPMGANYVLFEIGDENRKCGIARTTAALNAGTLIPTNTINVYEPRWSPLPIN